MMFEVVDRPSQASWHIGVQFDELVLQLSEQTRRRLIRVNQRSFTPSSAVENIAYSTDLHHQPDQHDERHWLNGLFGCSGTVIS